MTQLLSELQGGRATFDGYGVVAVNDNTFGEVKTSVSGFKSQALNLTLNMGQGQVAYLRMWGGVNPQKGILYRFSREQGQGLIQIPYQNRLNPQIVEQVRNPYTFSIVKDANGKRERQQFISELDAIPYLQENLKDGMEVYVRGEVEYRLYNGEVQRNLNVNFIALNEERTDREGNVVPKGDNGLEITQTYLVDSNSVSSTYLTELKKNGKTKINAYVPQYISQYEGKDVKKVVALAQPLVVKTEDDKLDRAKALIENFLKPADSNTVRSIILRNRLNSGYEVQETVTELTEEQQRLVDIGIYTVEQLQKANAVTGARVNELVVEAPLLVRNENNVALPVVEDKYTTAVLVNDLTVDEEEVDLSEPDTTKNVDVAFEDSDLPF